MRKIIKLLLLCVIVLSLNCENSDDQLLPSPQSTLLTCLPVDLQTNVVAFYPFNNGSLNDESGNNNNLINNTTASSTTDRNGNLNCAFGFNPSNGDFLENNDTSFLDDLHVDGFSISFWYMAIDDTGSALFISRDDENNECGYIGQWSIHYVDENFFFGANGKRGIGHHISVLDWEHIVLTIDGTNLRFYKNGVLEAEELNSPFESCTTNPTINDGDLFIGRFFDGKMDDIIIYDRVLTPTEATELFNTSACCN